MKKRVMFVDDEPNVLSGLRRSLHGMREVWDMRFVESAEAALQALGKEPYDAIVSDMRMPLMDGADLLDQVKQRYPDTVRMILSGQASRGAVFRSISPAHQFLSKPCDPQELANRLNQAFAMRDLLSNQSVKTVVSRLRSLPSLPALYDEVMAQLRSEDPSFTQIARIISKDVGMATKILQLANSAFMGTGGRVSSLLQSLTLIGLDNVRTLVLSVNVFSQFDGNARVAANLPCLWEHSIAVSKLAQQIAAAENCPKALLEECFTAGLLHDLGKLVLLAEFPKEYLQAYTAKSDMHANGERERIGCTHAEVGAYLMSIWGLPFPLVHAVAYHHHPAETAETKFSTLTAVHAADAIASEGDPSPLNHDIALDQPYLNRLGLSERESVWRSLYKSNPSPPHEAK
ncbi:MAG: HDOD domain-containing protein [Acidobacteriia bacterium]|nr:HDOD domain-containing protein [Terriglobia bacterium]